MDPNDSGPLFRGRIDDGRDLVVTHQDGPGTDREGEPLVHLTITLDGQPLTVLMVDGSFRRREHRLRVASAEQGDIKAVAPGDAPRRLHRVLMRFAEQDPERVDPI